MTSEAAAVAPPPATGTWTALVNSTFRNFWFFSFLAFTGASMQTVGAGWLMTQLDPSPAKVSLVQAAFSLSAFVIGLPAGVLADVLDRRWVMVGALACLMAVTGALGVMSLQGMITPNLLIVMTFLFGLAAATVTPAMQATTPDLVPREHLPSALTLNGMNNSIARSVGPALAGVLLGLLAAGYMFLINAATFIGLFIVILLWRNTTQPAAPQTGFMRALREGLAFSFTRKPLQHLLLKMVLNFFAVSIVLALVPLIVEQRLDGQPQTLGLLLACFGIGSVSGSLLLSKLYARFSRSRVVDLATVTHALATLCVGLSMQRYFSAAAMLVAGMSWTAMLTSINIVAQMLLPARVRARGLSINMMALMGSMAFGAAIWGQVAERIGLRDAFVAACIVGVLMPLLTARLRLVEQMDDEVPPKVNRPQADA